MIAYPELRLYNEGYTFSLTVIRSRIKLFENNILKGGG